MSELLRTTEGVSDVKVLNRISLLTKGEWRAALEALGGLRGLLLASDEVLLEHLPPRAVSALRASLDLSRRLHLATDERIRVGDPSAAANFARPLLGHLPVERFLMLCLNSRNALLKHVIIATGSVDQCAIDPREVFGVATSCRASAILLVHNHPSGDVEPSQLDITLTRRIARTSQDLCMRLVDHIIVAAGAEYCSLRQRLGVQAFGDA